jgi:hypothetical protein
MPQTQKVTLTVDKDGYAVADPTKIPDRRIGDKLRFDSKYRKFEVTFDRWIFSGDEHPITDRRARIIRSQGPYHVDCVVITPQGPTRYKKKGGADTGAFGNVRP